jgi:hypothetical protein
MLVFLYEDRLDQTFVPLFVVQGGAGPMEAGSNPSDEGDPRFLNKNDVVGRAYQSDGREWS